jgi:hypothetical protein
MRRRILIISAAAAVVAAGALLLQRQRASPPHLAISAPRTVATFPQSERLSVAGRYSWLDEHTLLLEYQAPGPRRPPPGPHDHWVRWHVLSGIISVDLGTGKAIIIRAPRPLGEPQMTVRTWDEHTRDGGSASVHLPPVKMGSIGATTYRCPVACPATGLIAYDAEVAGADGRFLPSHPEKGLWICRRDGSHAIRVRPWYTEPQAWSADGQWLVFRIQGDRRKHGLWVCRADGSAASRVAPGSGAHFLGITPDGRGFIYSRFAASKQFIYRQDFRSGLPRAITQWAESPAWVDGKLLVVKSIRKQLPGRRRLLPWLPPRPARMRETSWIEAVNPATGKGTRVEQLPLRVGRYSLYGPPRDSRLFILGQYTDHTVQTSPSSWSTTTETTLSLCVLTPRLQLVRLPDWVYPAWSPDGKRLAYIEGSEIKVVEVGLKRAMRR